MSATAFMRSHHGKSFIYLFQRRGDNTHGSPGVIWTHHVLSAMCKLRKRDAACACSAAGLGVCLVGLSPCLVFLYKIIVFNQGASL
jgi:hypothetical protein